jgi:CRISPR-associated endonuclease/helicase Cas3
VISLPLLAKSIENAETVHHSATLKGHLKDCFSSGNSIVEVVGYQMLQAFGLRNPDWLLRLSNVLSLAAAIHDIGKSNNHFQNAVHGLAAPEDRQPIRHEWISVWIAMQPAVKAWLMPAVGNCDSCWHVAMFAVGGHHRKSVPTDDCFAADFIEVHVDHDDFRACLQQFKDWFDLGDPPEVDGIVYQGPRDVDRREAFLKMLSGLGRQWRKLKKDTQWKKFSAVVKATVIGADVAGSALWEQIDSPEQRAQWIKSSLERTPNQADLNEIVRARLGKHPPREFQKQVAASASSVTLVEAGCGGGKTAAAYMWAANQHAGRRLWFCYPTTGTATEGYRGYLLDKLPTDSISRTDLFHSRREYDIERMLGDRASADFDDNDSAVRVQSLQAWDTQIVSCTVDNVLFLLQNQRRGIYAWPALANSAIVFDEIHCYDDLLFGNLLTWLENLVGIPVLLMTASLPKAKREAIQNVCENASRSLTHIPNGPLELEELPRYQNATAKPLENVDDCMTKVADELASGGRILWISNTVERTRNVGQHVGGYDIAAPVFYHSRFIYKDRIDRHTDVVDLFETERKAGFASTSQVAEMSLDLGHATLLVTELAPIPALIQRLGRLNRRADPLADPAIIRSFIVLEPVDTQGEFSRFPYDAEELELARQWLGVLGQGPISQSDLVRAWHDLDESSELFPVDSGWLEGGINTPVDSIRESSYGITVICDRHLASAKRESAAKYALPMDRPKRENWQATDFRFRGFPIASDDAIDYDQQEGARWATHNVF